MAERGPGVSAGELRLSMRIDVNCFIGEYPYRHVPGGTPDALLAAMDRVGIDRAWVSHLDGIFSKDPTASNPVLYGALEGRDRLRPVPAVHPDLPNRDAVLDDAQTRTVPCVRADPCFYGTDAGGASMRALARAAAARALPLMLAVRLEDVRQRHANDRAPELAPGAVRALLRADPRVDLIVTHADRDFIEQVHFGSTPEEARRVRWDISWIWGPPEDHLALLIRTMGADRFLFGTGMPLRIPEAAVAKVELLGESGESVESVGRLVG